MSVLEVTSIHCVVEGAFRVLEVKLVAFEVSELVGWQYASLDSLNLR
jgi:hypothetical protein